MDIAWLGGLDGEAFVPERDVDLLQVPVGLLELGDAEHAELFDEPVLGGAEVALDPALGLRRVGQDQFDVELAKGGSDHRRRVHGIALLEREVGSRPRAGPTAEVARLVGVERERPTPAPQVVDRDLSVGWTVIARNEAGHHQPVRRIVMHLDQHLAACRPLLEPLMLGAVPLDQLADARRRGRALRWRAPRRLGFQCSSSIIHPRSVCAFSAPISGSRDRCSAKSVGPKSRKTGSCTRTITRARRSAGAARFERRSRSPWMTTPSPSASQRRRRRRNCRGLSPTSSAPRAA
jgi:hypothetical protein